MITIGFATKFYTLWDVTTETVVVNQNAGAFYCVTKCTYIKNLSKNLEKAKIQAGTDNIDLDLRGQRSFSYRSETKVDSKYFPYGKLAFTLISESSDTWQLKRLAKDSKYPDNAQQASNRLVELGFINFEGEFLTQDEINAILEKREMVANSKKEVEAICKAGVIEFFAEKNFKVVETEEGYEARYSIEVGSSTLYLYLPEGEYKEMSYNGFEYALPIISGKAKKIKGKNVRFHFNQDSYITSIEIL